MPAVPLKPGSPALLIPASIVAGAGIIGLSIALPGLISGPAAVRGGESAPVLAEPVVQSPRDVEAPAPARPTQIIGLQIVLPERGLVLASPEAAPSVAITDPIKPASPATESEPAAAEPPQQGVSGEEDRRVVPVGLRIDLNTATVAQLQLLSGIGPVLAQRIVDDREANGRFSSVDELKRVKGIGDKTLDKLRASIYVARP